MSGILCIALAMVVSERCIAHPITLELSCLTALGIGACIMKTCPFDLCPNNWYYIDKLRLCVQLQLVPRSYSDSRDCCARNHFQSSIYNNSFQIVKKMQIADAVIIEYLSSTGLNIPIWNSVINQSTCQSLNYAYFQVGNIYEIQAIRQSIPCNSNLHYICQIKAPRCSLSIFQENMLDYFNIKIVLNSNQINLYGDNLAINQSALIQCDLGYYPSKETIPVYMLTTSQNNYISNSELKHNQIFCSGYSNNQDKSLMEISTKVHQCHQVICKAIGSPIANVKYQKHLEYSLFDYLPFGQQIFYECDRGFVSYNNSSITLTSLLCSQSDIEPTKGYWYPLDMEICKPVKCEVVQLMHLLPNNTFITEIYSPVNSPIKLSPFNNSSVVAYYLQIVVIKCNEGLIFYDRAVSKRIQCQLELNSWLTTEWVGIHGFKLPTDIDCMEAYCLTDDLVELITDNLDYNIKRKFIYIHPNGTTEMKLDDVYYFYNVGIKLSFECILNYELATSATWQTITCNILGQWSPKLSKCLNKKSILKEGHDRKYQIKISEASNANTIGIISIMILIIVIGSILLFDLVNRRRDIIIFRKNIKNIKIQIIKNKSCI